MKRIAVAIATIVVVLSGATAAFAGAIGKPLVDPTKGTMNLKASGVQVRRCVGVNNFAYETFRGNWNGIETDGMPGSTPYNLSGTLAVHKWVWTINLKSQRGVFRGKAVLTGNDATGSAPQTVYEGPITLVTQGLPASAGNGVQARGWINGATYTKGVKDGGSFLANVEFNILSTLQGVGEWGGAPAFDDLSAVTNNKAC